MKQPTFLLNIHKEHSCRFSGSLSTGKVLHIIHMYLGSDYSSHFLVHDGF